MKVLSLKEPYATLIKMGVKKLETRSWKTNYRGELYIHTSKKVDPSFARNKPLQKLVGNTPLSFGKIICKCELVDCVLMTESFIEKIKKEEEEYLCGIYQVGRYAWILKNIEEIDEIETKGHLGIWNYEE